AAAEELPRPLGDSGEHVAEMLRPGEGLGELGEVLELADALSSLLVEACVLDSAGHERGRGREELDLLGGELARRLCMHRDRADDVAVSSGDRNGEQRMDLLLLELGDELVARVVDRVLREGRLAVLDCPPRDALALAESDLADETSVRPRAPP